MNASRITPTLSRRRGFTFVETLAALALLAVLVPVAMQGVRVANRIGEVAHHKRAAVALGEQRLLEAVQLEEYLDGTDSGDFGEDWPGYSWKLDSEDWGEDIMRLVTLDVGFTVQGNAYSIRLATLAPEEDITGDEEDDEEESA